MHFYLRDYESRRAFLGAKGVGRINVKAKPCKGLQ